MNLKTLRQLAITSTVLAGVAALGVSGISAASPAQETPVQEQSHPLSNLIKAIAQKFNLNVSDVQKIFEEQRAQIETQRGNEQATRLTERLTQAVNAGKLTQTQADLLKAKHEELRTFRESLKGKTREECKAAMETKLAELKTWAKANAIPDEFAQFGPMGGPRGGHMGQTNDQRESGGRRGPGRGQGRGGFQGNERGSQGNGQGQMPGLGGQNNR